MKGIDVSGPVVGDATYLKVEEHNLGKLMRIPVDNENRAVPQELANHPSVAAYRIFRSFVLSSGLAYNAARLLHDLGIVCDEPDQFIHPVQSMQTVAHGFVESRSKEVIIASTGRLELSLPQTYITELRNAGIESGVVLVFTDKFNWSLFEYHGATVSEIGRGKKYYPAVQRVRSFLGV